jgi:hypothetical protein
MNGINKAARDSVITEKGPWDNQYSINLENLAGQVGNKINRAPLFKNNPELGAALATAGNMAVGMLSPGGGGKAKKVGDAVEGIAKSAGKIGKKIRLDPDVHPNYTTPGLYIGKDVHGSQVLMYIGESEFNKVRVPKVNEVFSLDGKSQVGRLQKQGDRPIYSGPSAIHNQIPDLEKVDLSVDMFPILLGKDPLLNQVTGEVWVGRLIDKSGNVDVPDLLKYLRENTPK